jgi:hypothetical protein
MGQSRSNQRQNPDNGLDGEEGLQELAGIGSDSCECWDGSRIDLGAPDEKSFHDVAKLGDGYKLNAVFEVNQ